MNLNLLTAATEQAPEAVEEATNFFQQAADWLNGNPGVLACILFGLGALIGVGCYFAKRKGRK